MSLSADLNGKRALITGASSQGFGRFFAKKLAASGASVTVAARRLSALESLVSEIESDGGVADAVELDVIDIVQIKDEISRKPPFDIVINNAGVSVAKPILEQSEEDYDFVMDTNLKGCWNIGKETARRNIAAGKGSSIINIASITGLRQVTGISPYAISKAAVVQMTKQMALEFARHDIRVNCIVPGYFKSDLTRDLFKTEAGAALIKRIPMRRLGDYESLGGALLLLASDASSFMTGSVLTVDGGHLISSL